MGGIAGGGVSGGKGLTGQGLGGYFIAMDTTSITIDLPRKTRAFVDQQATAQGFASSEDYIRSVLEAEEERSWRNEIERLLLEGLNSGPATPLTKQDWVDIRREAKARLAKMKNHEFC